MSEMALGRQTIETVPTGARRLLRAEGRGTGSTEVGSVAVLTAAVIALFGFGPGMIRSALILSRAYLGGFTSVEIGPGAVTPLVLHLAGSLAATLLPLGAIVALAGVVTEFGHRPPAPAEGLRRILSRHGGFELGKFVVKLALLGGAVTWALRCAFEEVFPLGASELASTVRILPETMLRVAASGTLALGTVAMLDLAFRRRGRERSLALKRGLQDDLRGRRMVRDARQADVIVVDGTRLAVALRYEPGRMRAPRVLVCGARRQARRLCEVGDDAGIPLVRNATVARALERSCPVGAEIPRELYEAVAELLADVYRAQAAAPRAASTSIGTVKLDHE